MSGIWSSDCRFCSAGVNGPTLLEDIAETGDAAGAGARTGERRFRRADKAVDRWLCGLGWSKDSDCIGHGEGNNCTEYLGDKRELWKTAVNKRGKEVDEVTMCPVACEKVETVSGRQGPRGPVGLTTWGCSACIRLGRWIRV